MNRNNLQSVNTSNSNSFVKVLFRKPVTFQKITILVATIVFTIAIILLSYLFYVLNKSRIFPPDITECPDYFEVKGKNICENVNNIGTCPDKTFDFNDNIYKGYNGLKEKLKWANNCNVVWDGITNNAELYQ